MLAESPPYNCRTSSPSQEAGVVCSPSVRSLFVSDLIACSATELARRIRRRECSPLDVLEAHLERLHRWNPAVNAVVTIDADGACARAQRADRALERGHVWGPLHGLPITVKDQFATDGLDTTYGLPPYASSLPDDDAPLVARLRRAGAVLVGKSNLPTLAYDWQCEHPTFGRTNNPWALDHTPGGSSGGSAAALAAGFTPLELGADAGGSIRVPSHFCGVVGLRPSEHVLPLSGITPPDRPQTIRHIVAVGPMARTVEDLQLAWSILHPSSPLADEPVEPETLRIAVTPELGDVPVDTDTWDVLQTAVETWTDAGSTVERRVSPLDVSNALDVWGEVHGFELTAGLPFPLRTFPAKHFLWQGPVRSRFGFLADRLDRGARLGNRGYRAALERKEQIAQTLDAFLKDWDCWITPVAAISAFPHCPTGAPLSLEGIPVPYPLPIAPYTCATAVPGHPILTIPAGQSSEGLPIGLQVHARRGDDARLLSVGRCLTGVLGREKRLAPLAPYTSLDRNG